MNEFTEKLKPFAPLFLRIGLAVVFVLFGLQKLSFPSQGTAEIQQIFTSASTGESMVGLAVASAMNYYMGLFELMLGLALLTGKMLKYAAPLGALLVLVIFATVTFVYGMNAEDKTLLLDAALIGSALALWAFNSEKWRSMAPVLLRIGMALSFVLLGYQKIAENNAFLLGCVEGLKWLDVGITTYVQYCAGFLFEGGVGINIVSFWVGCAEVVLAILLLAGFVTRYVAPVAALLVVWSLFEAIGARGFLIHGMLPDPTLSRDIGVIGGALALWALGAGMWSVDGRKKEIIPSQ